MLPRAISTWFSFPFVLLAAKGDKGGIRIFRLFLARNPLPPFAFKVVDIPAWRSPSCFLKGFRREQRKTAIALDSSGFPVGEGDNIRIQGESIIRQVVDFLQLPQLCT